MTAGPVKVIVNADDFGQSSTVNKAIAECFRHGLISSTTILANMPGFEEACELATANDFVDRVGLHLNLTEGKPLSPQIRQASSLCDASGHFRRFRSAWLSRSDLSMIALEVAAQIQRCRQAGISLTHADSHQHVHNEPMVLKAILPVLKASDIRRLRISRNMDSLSLISLKGMAKSCFNRWLTVHGLRGTDYFGTVENFARFRDQNLLAGGSFEIMTHPSLDEQGNVFDHIDNLPLIERLQRIFQDITLTSYRSARTT